MNKYIEKIYDKDNELYVYISKDINNAENDALKIVFDETEQDENINMYKQNYYNYFYKTIYVYLPQGLDTVKEHVFGYAFCDLRKKWTKDKNKAFFNVHIHFVLPEGLKKIENYGFYGSLMHWVNLPESLEYIGDYSFYGAFFYDGFSLTIPKNVSYIGKASFSCYDGEFILEETENYFSDGYAIYDKKEKMLLSYFGESKGLSSYTVWAQTEKIHSGAFCFAGFLKEIFIPYNVTKIEMNTFADCLSKPKIVLQNFDTIICYLAVNNKTKVEFPDGSFKIIDNQDNWEFLSYNMLDSFEFQYEEENSDQPENIEPEKDTPTTKEMYTGEQSNLDIDAIEKMLEDNKKNEENVMSKNPFDFDADEIFKDVDYDYNPFDFEPVKINDEDEE